MLISIDHVQLAKPPELAKLGRAHGQARCGRHRDPA
jgi:hypothetical protein